MTAARPSAEPCAITFQVPAANADSATNNHATKAAAAPVGNSQRAGR
jgi:hypothetical protein